MKQTDLGVLIIGAGRVSHSHARAVDQTEGAKLIAVADVDKTRAEEFAARYSCLSFQDYAEALRRDDVHIATIALPHDLHERVTVDCCQAGKHVFIEKPMADTVEECQRMIAAAERTGVQLFVAHTQRYFASTIRGKRAPAERRARSTDLRHGHLVQAVCHPDATAVVPRPRPRRRHVADERGAHD